MGMIPKSGIEMIAEERQLQVAIKVFTPEHDDTHTAEELAQAAAFYADPSGKAEFPTTWNKRWNKKDTHNRIRQLTIAGALCAAEIDRLVRTKLKK